MGVRIGLRLELPVYDGPSPRRGFPGGSVVKKKKKKNPPASAGATEDAVSIPGWGRSPGGGNGNPSQYSCLENLMNRETWLTTVQGVARGTHD